MRVEEQQRLIERELSGSHIRSAFRGRAPMTRSGFTGWRSGLEEEKEGGERCFRCYELRFGKRRSVRPEKGLAWTTLPRRCRSVR